jgi:hypothetical protein
VGSGAEVSIRELATMIGDVVGFEGRLDFDASKPDGTPRKLADVIAHANQVIHSSSKAVVNHVPTTWHYRAFGVWGLPN